MQPLSVNPIFSDGMVLQRDVPTVIWGTAPDGHEIRLSLAGQTCRAVSDGGRWETCLSPLAAGGPYDLEIACLGKQIHVRNILAGEIWIAGGQSNMEWPLKHSRSGSDAVKSAKFDQIRFFNVQKIRFPEETKEHPEAFSHPSAWRPATDEHAGDFSAVAYHFARDLHDHLGVPIGIIECNLGGSSASAWTSRSYLNKDIDVKSYLDDYDQSVESLDMTDYISKCRTIYDGLARYQDMPVDPENESDTPPFDPASFPPEALQAFMTAMQPGPRAMFGHPGSLFDNMLMTVVPYTAQGVIFYQGESDTPKARIYAKLFKLLIENWRHAFQNPALHFLFVQLAAYGNEGYPDGDMYAILRDQQHQVARTVSKTGMAVALDVGHRSDIHPRSKLPVGIRLALLAREKVYGEAIDSSGPVYRSMKIDGSKIILTFDHAEPSLICMGDSPCGFQICGPNRLYFECEAKVVNNTVELQSPQVPLPAAARYGWANYTEANLYNINGLPMLPFKTDRYL